jgi:thioredoxin-related protein
MKSIPHIAAFILCMICCSFVFASDIEPKTADITTPSDQTGSSTDAVTPQKEATGINWLPYDKVEIGKTEGKKVFLHFYADWCHYCKEMNKKTFSNKPVFTYINEHFVAIKVNRDKEKDVARKYPARGLPSSWFFKENGEKITELPGYVAPETFINILKYIESDSFDKMDFVEFLEKQK